MADLVLQAGCTKDGFIMSPSRGTKGESRWSKCSVQALREADLSCLEENSGGATEQLDIEAGVYPGEVWSASRQCQIFLLDSDAHMDHTDASFAKMCYSLKCRTPKREGEIKANSFIMHGLITGVLCVQATTGRAQHWRGRRVGRGSGARAGPA